MMKINNLTYSNLKVYFYADIVVLKLAIDGVNFAKCNGYDKNL